MRFTFSKDFFLFCPGGNFVGVGGSCVFPAGRKHLERDWGRGQNTLADFCVCEGGKDYRSLIFFCNITLWLALAFSSAITSVLLNLDITSDI